MVKLRAELSTRLGRQVELVTSEPTDAEPDGVLIVEDRATGEWLDIDPVTIAEVVAAHVPPARQLSAEEQALAALESETTLVGVRAVFRAYLVRAVAEQAAARDQMRMLRRRSRERRAR